MRRYIICKWDHGQWHMTHWLAGSMIYEQNNNVDWHTRPQYMIIEKWISPVVLAILDFWSTQNMKFCRSSNVYSCTTCRYLGIPRQKKQPSNQNSSKNNFTYFPIKSNVKTVSLGGSHVGFLIHNKHKLFRRLFKEHFHHTTIQSYMWFLKIKYFKFEPIRKHYWPSSHLEIWKEKKSHPGQVGFRLIQLSLQKKNLKSKNLTDADADNDNRDKVMTIHHINYWSKWAKYEV